MSLSKVLDTINHELLFAKSYASEFSQDSLKLILIYVTDLWQRGKIKK